MDKDYGIYKYANLGAGHLTSVGYWGTLSLEEIEERKMKREAEYRRFRSEAEAAQDKLINGD